MPIIMYQKQNMAFTPPEQRKKSANLVVGLSCGGVPSRCGSAWPSNWPTAPFLGSWWNIFTWLEPPWNGRSIVSYSTDLKNLEVAQATNCCSEAIEIHGLSYFRPMTSLPNGGATKQFIYFLSSYLDAKSVVLKYISLDWGLHKERLT